MNPDSLAAVARTARRPAGFTLIELMVVLMLLAILTALIVPELTGTRNEALLRATGRKAIDACNLANSRAVSTSRAQRVLLDPGQGHYRIETVIRNSGDERNLDPQANPDTIQGSIDSRIAIEIHTADRPPEYDSNPPARLERPDQTSRAIHFYPDGTADPCDIVLRDGTGVQLALRINPTTARITLIEGGRP